MEFFRHLRPTQFDWHSMTVTPQAKGGVTFLFKPTGQDRLYDFWVYICPLDVPFSSKTAVARLRANVAQDVVPWGVIALDDSPAIDKVLEAIGRIDDLPTTLTGIAAKIVEINKQEQDKWDKAVVMREQIADDIKNGREPSFLLGNPF